jgi:acetyl esterase/lipase
MPSLRSHVFRRFMRLAIDCDILLSDAIRLAERAREVGVSVTFKVWNGLWHVFHTSASIVPEARRAINELGIFVVSISDEESAGAER